MAFGKEIKRLREEVNLSAQKLADIIGIDADRLRKWEQRNLNPRDEDTQKIEAFFGIPLADVCRLITIRNFLLVPNPVNGKLEYSYLEDRRSKKAGQDNENDGIIYVPLAAQAGYSTRYHDHMYLEQLEKVHLPGFPYRGERYRVFDVKGDSMEPTYKEGYHLVCERVEQDSWQQIANFYVYVIVFESDILVKRLFYKKDANLYAAISDNEEFYPQFPIALTDVKELWQVKRKIDWEMAPPKKFEITI